MRKKSSLGVHNILFSLDCFGKSRNVAIFAASNRIFKTLSMAKLAIMNYEMACIELITLSDSTIEKYSSDYDHLVYEVMGYNPSTVYYMVAEDICICDVEESNRMQ